MQRAVWACLALVFLVGVSCSDSWAVERQLAGVRLGTTTMELLEKPGYGQPDFIGPLGALSVAPDQPTGRQAAAGWRSHW